MNKLIDSDKQIEHYVIDPQWIISTETSVTTFEIIISHMIFWKVIFGKTSSDTVWGIWMLFDTDVTWGTNQKGYKLISLMTNSFLFKVNWTPGSTSAWMQHAKEMFQMSLAHWTQSHLGPRFLFRMSDGLQLWICL